MLEHVLNTDPNLHSVCWNPGEQAPGVLAHALPGADWDTPRMFTVTPALGMASQHGPRNEHGRTDPAFVNEVTRFSCDSQIREDGILDPNVTCHYTGELGPASVPFTTELCIVIGEAATCWRLGSGAELRIMAHTGEDVTVLTLAPDEQRGGLTLRSYGETFSLQERQQIHALNYRTFFGAAGHTLECEELHVGAQYLSELEHQAGRVRQSSGQGQAPQDDSEQTLRQRQTLQQDLYALQVQLAERIGADRTVTADIDHGSPWGRVRVLWTEGTGLVTTVSPSSEVPQTPRGSLTPLVAQLCEYGTLGDGALFLMCAGTGKASDVQVPVHPELCMLLLRVLQDAPDAQQLHVQLDLHPDSAHGGIHPWEAYDLQAGEHTSTACRIQGERLVVTHTDPAGQTRSGQVELNSVTALLAQICRRYLSVDLPRWLDQKPTIP